MLELTVEAIMSEVRDAKEALKPFLRKRAEVIRHMAGNHYRDDAKGPPSPENYPFAYKSFVMPQLLFGTPKPVVKANSPIYKDTADDLQMALNYWSQETDWRDSLEAIVGDCFVGFGFSKAGISPVGRYFGEGLTAVEGDFEQVPNYPFIVRVDPRNAIIDPLVKSMQKARILGETYEQDIDDVKADWRNDPAAVEQLAQTSREDEEQNDTSPYKNTKRSSSRKRVVLHEVYLREHGVLMTIGETGSASGVILRQEKYWGPDEGPYTLWGLDVIPGELMPISPLVAMWDEYLEVQQHSSTAADSASTYKSIGVYSPAGEDDAQKIQNADNGDLVACKDPSAIKTLEIGGASQSQLSFVEYCRTRFQNNIGFGSSQQGVAVGKKTATEEAIANQNSDLRVDRMRDRIAYSCADAYRKPAWYFFKDESIGQMETTHTDPATGEQLPAVFRSGPWAGGFINGVFLPPENPSDFDSDYTFEVDASSMVKKDDALEQKRAQDELTLVYSMLVPILGPQMINHRRVIDRYGDAIGTKDLSKIILLDQGMLPPDPWSMGPQMLGAQPGAKPAGTQTQRPGSPSISGTPRMGSSPNPLAGMLGAQQRAPGQGLAMAG